MVEETAAKLAHHTRVLLDESWVRAVGSVTTQMDAAA